MSDPHPDIEDLLALARRVTAGDAAACEADALGDAYEALLAAPGRRSRKGAGLFYTPPALVDAILDHALDPLLDRPVDGLRALRICDPACGCGRFLMAAATRIASRLQAAGGRASDAAECLFGVDIDPAAVEICRAAVWRASGGTGPMPEGIASQFASADSLALPLPPPLDRFGFDVVVGNPPFVNGIEGINAQLRTRIKQRWPDMAGPVDLSGAFLRLSAELARPGGRIGLIQPLIALSSRTLTKFREAPPSGLRPNLILIPPRSSLFRPAAVYVCALLLGPGEECIVIRDSRPPETMRIEGGDWWLAISGTHDSNGGRTIGDAFDVAASMTVGEAYEAARLIVDDPDPAVGPRLVTTGLIDPRECLWGKRECRFLGGAYAYPRLPRSADVSASLGRRIARAGRPKILVAGLSRRIEAFIDSGGECLGAVSTFSILHPSDDGNALAKLCDFLHSTTAHDAYLAHLGAYRVGGGDITMRKDFLRGLPLPT